MEAPAFVPGPALAALSSADRADLSRLESVIDRGWDTFREVAFALLEIHERRLYREEFASFADYCRERWGFSGRYGNRMIQAAELVKECEAEGRPPPANECQARRMRAKATTALDGADVDRPELHRRDRREDDRRLLGQRIAETRPGLAKTAAIEKHLAELRELHAGHPWRPRADELLTLYRETVLPWPAEC